MKNYGHENGINFAGQICLAMTHSCYFFEESAVPWNVCFELYNYDKPTKLGMKKNASVLIKKLGNYICIVRCISFIQSFLNDRDLIRQKRILQFLMKIKIHSVYNLFLFRMIYQIHWKSYSVSFWDTLYI